MGDLQKAYGTNNVISAVRFAKTASTFNVARIILQHCGYRDNLSESLRYIMRDKAGAKVVLSPKKYEVACRLELASAPIFMEIAATTKSILGMWEVKAGRERTTILVEYAIRAAVTKYGPNLARRGIQLVTMNINILEPELLQRYHEWLVYSSQRNLQALERLLPDCGYQGGLQRFKIPPPVSMRAEKYFTAKAFRLPTDEENWELWCLLEKYSIDEILHAMSCIPAAIFTMEQIRAALSNNIAIGHPRAPTRDNNKAYKTKGNEEDNEDSDEVEFEDEGVYDDFDYESESDFYEYSTYDENALESDDYMR